MTEGFAQARDPNGAEVALRLDLARGDKVIESIGPVLRHLLASEELSLFADDVIATVRGMIDDIARQLLAAALQGHSDAGRQPDAAQIESLAQLLIGQAEFLGHVHCVALEAQLSARMEARLGLDPVLSPLLQALVGANTAEVSSAAMALLAAQARFVQNCRRMQLPLGELPGDVLHVALQTVEELPGSANRELATSTIRAGYDESLSRLGLVSRLVAALGGGIMAALSISHAGVAIFLTALSHAAGQERDAVVLATSETQIARLGLMLSVAGLKSVKIAEQIEALHPDVDLRHSSDAVTPDQAAMLLARPAHGVGI